MATVSIQPYLFFGGRCDEAIEFYRQALVRQVRDADALQGQPGSSAARRASGGV